MMIIRKANKVRLKRNRWSTFDTLVTIIAILACFVTLYPMIYVFSCSISNPGMVSTGQVTFFPKGFSLEAYKIVLWNRDFWIGTRNSIIYVVAGCILMLVNTVAMAYPLTRPNLKFRKFITYFLLIQMYFGGGMIPTFIVITKLGLYNSPWALILPGYSIWNIILCRTFMSSLPDEMIDAALVDGADQIKTLLKIVVPLAKPVLAVIMIYTIVGIWNSWFSATIYVTKPEIQPVQVYLKKILNSTKMDKDLMDGMTQEMQLKYLETQLAANQIKYALIIVVVAPILAIYPYFRKYFTKGVMLGSLKG